MLETFFHWLISNEFFLVFLLIGLGIAVGKVSVKGISFGSSAVIFVSIFFGYLLSLYGFVEYQVPKIVGNTGLVLFIFTIGMQAGPSFFETFKSSGRKLIVLAMITVFGAGIVSFIFSKVLGVNSFLGIGVFTGALTSTPGLAAAIDVTQSPLASIGYGIAYPFGVVGVILFVKIAPRIFGVDVKEEERKYEVTSHEFSPLISFSHFLVKNSSLFGRSLKEINLRKITGATISRIQRGDVPMPVEDATILEENDIVRAVGVEDSLKEVEIVVGPETDHIIPQSSEFEIKWYIVSRKDVVGKPFKHFNLSANYRATATRVQRAGTELSASPNLMLRYGDKILISSSKGNVDALSRLFGNQEKSINTASFLPIALGVVIGALVGLITIPLPLIGEFSLGLSGGVLLSSLLLSRQGKTGPIIWFIPDNANALLREFGLLLFLIPVGIDAGTHIMDVINEYGVSLMLVGMAVTVLPMVLTISVGTLVMKENFLQILGALTGGMTSTPGLSAVDSMSESEAPQIAYASVYPFAMVSVIIAVQILSYF